MDLKEPHADRVMHDVVAPPLLELTKEQLFHTPDGLPDIDLLKAHLIKEGRLSLPAAMALVKGAERIFRSEPNILELKYPITVCGDVHGQFFDLVRLFEVGGDPKTTQFLFLGDYVDRGCFSSEVVFFLYALKMTFPKTLFMLRGNHECRQLTAFFNFKDECGYKYNLEFYDAVMNSFDHLPIGCIVQKAFFCVHGGLSPDISSLEEIRALDRHQEVPREGAMCDLLWSDPTEDPAAKWFSPNNTRQCSYFYGVDAVRKFLKENKLTSMIRAHEAQADGYKMQMVNNHTGIPRVITIFSAPNYCDVFGNKAACLKFDNNVLNIKQFIECAHPYYLPNFMDVFQWSLPFVAEKVNDMLSNLLEFDEEPTQGQYRSPFLLRRGGLIKKKVIAAVKLILFLKALRQYHAAISRIKQKSSTRKLPFGLLRAGPALIEASAK